MWIFDSYYRGSVELWDREGGLPKPLAFRYSPSFYLHLEDPHAHWEMMEGLESRFRVEECSFDAVYGPLDGYEIWAGRDVAEKIEKETRLQAQLYNVDLRLDQRFLAEKGLFPCGSEGDSRFVADFHLPLTYLTVEVDKDPRLSRTVTEMTARDGRQETRLAGPERKVLADLFDLVKVEDPDLILFPDADLWVPRLVAGAERYGLDPTLSRTGWFRNMASRSYWSYGRVEHRHGASIPEGRILIDTENSFTYREGGIGGVILASRLTGLSPNLTSRFTPGTLISNYEVYEALRRGIAVPFRKHDPEGQRKITELKAADKGGMIFQPRPGIHERAYELDFTSFYPSIIVNYNLSPETVGGSRPVGPGPGGAGPDGSGGPARRGFLSEVIEPLLELRLKTKRLKKTEPRYGGLDSALKWMLVTCFGYTGYKNAKFGRIEVHEAITRISRDLLLQAKDIAEGLNLEVLHGIVDCLWVKVGDVSGSYASDGSDFSEGSAPSNGSDSSSVSNPSNGSDSSGVSNPSYASDVSSVSLFKERVEAATGIGTELDPYDWIVFLPLADGFGAYNRYFGRLSSGKLKVRGVAARRRDTPEYVRRMQMEVFEKMGVARSIDELGLIKPEALKIARRYRQGLPDADPSELVVRRRISKLGYQKRCVQASAISAYRRRGVKVSPGMTVEYVVRDADGWEVDAPWDASEFDLDYYGVLIQKAWEEAAFAFRFVEARSD